MILCKLNTDCEKNFYCDKVLSLCVSCWDICDPKKALKHECSQECSRKFLKAIFYQSVVNMLIQLARIWSNVPLEVLIKNFLLNPLPLKVL